MTRVSRLMTRLSHCQFSRRTKNTIQSPSRLTLLPLSWMKTFYSRIPKNNYGWLMMRWKMKAILKEWTMGVVQVAVCPSQKRVGTSATAGRWTAISGIALVSKVAIPALQLASVKLVATHTKVKRFSKWPSSSCSPSGGSNGTTINKFDHFFACIYSYIFSSLSHRMSLIL
jgi:hypothetical protein